MVLFRNTSLRGEINRIVLVSCFCALALALVALGLFHIETTRHEKEAKILALARLVAANNRATLAFNDADRASEYLQSLSAIESIDYAAVHRVNGKVLANYYSGQPYEEGILLAPEEPVTRRGNQLIIHLPVILDDGEQVGSITLISDAKDSRFALIPVVLQLCFVLAVSLLVAYLVSYRLQGRLSNPLRSLLEMVRRISQERDYSVRTPEDIPAPPEVMELIAGFNTMILEIEQREQLLMKERDRAEELAELKTQFVASMSHELRTPLNGIFGGLQMLEDSEIDEEHKEYLGMMKQSAEHLLQLTKEVFELSRSDQEHVSLQLSHVSLRKMIADIWRTIESYAERQQVNRTYYVDENVPDEIVTDTRRLYHVITNLLSNGIKFNRKGGTVFLHIFLVGRKGSEATLGFKVQDSGIGIPEDQLDIIFEPFTQVDSSYRRRYDGAGLGLTTAVRLVEILGGQLSVESEPSVGSVFSFTIDCMAVPIAEFSSITRSRRGEVIPLQNNRHDLQALVVDDNQISLEVLREALQRLGVTVMTASTVEEAMITISNSQPFSLVFIDVFPDLEEIFVLLKELKKLERYSRKDVRIYAMVDEADRGRILDLEVLEIDEIIPKPIRVSDLLAILGSYSKDEVELESKTSEN